MERFACGSLFSLPDLRDYVATTQKTAFPEDFELGVMPEVKSQGSVGSCVAHALSILTEYFNEKETGKFTKMSTGYIYGNRTLSAYKGEGMITRDAIKTLSKYGNVSYEKFPNNIEVPDAIEEYEKVADSLESVGTPYRIQSYFRLNTDEDIKAHLMDGNLVVFAMYWYDDIKIVDGVMVTDQVKTSKTGGHCMVIYGWNERGWLVQNSWGSDWGDGGRFVLPYNVSKKETWGTVDYKSDSTLDVTKPFNSNVGKAFAKCLHNICKFFHNLFNKIKNMFNKK